MKDTKDTAQKARHGNLFHGNAEQIQGQSQPGEEVVTMFETAMDNILGLRRNGDGMRIEPMNFKHGNILQKVEGIARSLRSLFRTLPQLYTKGRVPRPRVDAEAPPTDEQVKILQDACAIFTIFCHMVCDPNGLVAEEPKNEGDDNKPQTEVEKAVDIAKSHVDGSNASILAQFVISAWAHVNQGGANPVV